MRKPFLTILAVGLFALSLNSCATFFGGPVSACQRTRPLAGQPAREIRVVALVADILLLLPIVVTIPVDFLTGAIYRPCN